MWNVLCRTVPTTDEAVIGYIVAHSSYAMLRTAFFYTEGNQQQQGSSLSINYYVCKWQHRATDLKSAAEWNISSRTKSTIRTALYTYSAMAQSKNSNSTANLICMSMHDHSRIADRTSVMWSEACESTIQSFRKFTTHRQGFCEKLRRFVVEMISCMKRKQRLFELIHLAFGNKNDTQPLRTLIFSSLFECWIEMGSNRNSGTGVRRILLKTGQFSDR